MRSPAYYAELAKSLDDKLFFWPILQGRGIEEWVDFGCGDGSLLARLRYMAPEARRVGVESGVEAQLQASNKAQCAVAGGWESLRMLHNDRRPSALILSSVLHEVDLPWVDVWPHAEDIGPDFIVIRDMCISVESDFRVADPIWASGQRPSGLAAFEEEWGSVSGSQAVLIHFLLKYPWLRTGDDEDYERELGENYVKLTAEELLSITTENGLYRPIYFEHYTLPFVRNRVKQDFEYDLKDPTHVKMILQKVNG